MPLLDLLDDKEKGSNLEINITRDKILNIHFYGRPTAFYNLVLLTEIVEASRLI